jgi:hypothetical protein
LGDINGHIDHSLVPVFIETGDLHHLSTNRDRGLRLAGSEGKFRIESPIVFHGNTSELSSVTTGSPGQPHLQL